MHANAESDITAIVLAGGRSLRFGRDKAVEPIAGEPMIRRVIRRSAEGIGASEIMVVVSGLERAAELPLDPAERIVADLFSDSGPLGGIYTGLLSARTEWALVVACDLPFVCAALLRHMAGCRGEVDAVVPAVDGMPEPTHALYSKRCLPAIKGRLDARELKTSGFLDDVAVRYVRDDEAKRFDPDLLSLFNVNRPEDFARASELASAGH